MQAKSTAIPWTHQEHLYTDLPELKQRPFDILGNKRTFNSCKFLKHKVDNLITNATPFTDVEITFPNVLTDSKNAEYEQTVASYHSAFQCFAYSPLEMYAHMIYYEVLN